MKSVTLKEKFMSIFHEEQRLYRESLEKTRKVLERFRRTGKITYE